MAGHQAGERRLGRRIRPAREPLEQLPIAQSGQGPQVEERVNVAEDGGHFSLGHDSTPRSVVTHLYHAVEGGKVPTFWRYGPRSSTAEVIRAGGR